jgi:hypothetical protein
MKTKTITIGSGEFLVENILAIFRENRTLCVSLRVGETVGFIYPNTQLAHEAQVEAAESWREAMNESQ